jgi:hypothetical protein
MGLALMPAFPAMILFGQGALSQPEKRMMYSALISAPERK